MEDGHVASEDRPGGRDEDSGGRDDPGGRDALGGRVEDSGGGVDPGGRVEDSGERDKDSEARDENSEGRVSPGGHVEAPGGGEDGAPEPPELQWDAAEDGAVPASSDWCSSPGERPTAAGPGSPRSPPEPSPEPATDFELAAAAGPLPVELSGSGGCVWSAAAARRLRQLGVPGQMAGGLARAPRQLTQLGLPLALLPEETDLLARQGLAELVRYPELLCPRSADQRRLLDQQEEANTAAQQRLMTLARHKQLLERADQIVDGKWRKLERLRAAGKPTPDTSRQQLRFEFIEQLRASVRPPPAEQCYRQLYCGHPLALRPERVALPPPAGPMGRVRRAAYADLWRRGYWLTDGLKFGGHFLAYEGDPLVFHAAFVVRCVARRPHVRDLAGLQRLAHGCGKTLLLCWLDGGEVRHEVVSRRRRSLREVLPERAERTPVERTPVERTPVGCGAEEEREEWEDRRRRTEVGLDCEEDGSRMEGDEAEVNGERSEGCWGVDTSPVAVQTS